MASKRRRKAHAAEAPNASVPPPAGTRTILIAALMIVPVVYLAGYLALVRPGGVTFSKSYTKNGVRYSEISVEHYALLGARGERLFWPLERFDRRLRPRAWEAQPGLLGD